jgi:flagellin-like hook-associated protein FlgL
MTRITGRISSVEMTALKNLKSAQDQIASAGLQLSTLKRINRGKDDPAGLIAAENLRSELESLEAASRSSDRATAAVSLADTGLAQVSGLLNTVRDRVLASAGGDLSDAELAANQIEIDAALEAIDRIGAYTGLNDGGEIRFAPTGDVNEVAGLDLPELSSEALGSDEVKLSDLKSGGSESLARKRYAMAIGAVDSARDKVLSTRARLGAFEKYTIDASRNFVDNLQVTLSESLSRIEDTDVALAAAQMVRGQILADASQFALRTAASRHRLAELLMGRE